MAKVFRQPKSLFRLPERQLEEHQSISGCLKGGVKKINLSQAA
jgi:hypothetical protein